MHKRELEGFLRKIHVVLFDFLVCVLDIITTFDCARPGERTDLGSLPQLACLYSRTNSIILPMYKHAIKFCFSRWFPSINTRITDLILEMETQRRRQAEESFAYHRHLQRRQDGWVSGYKLKTKRYCGDQYHSDDSKNDIPTNNGEAKKDETSEESERDESDIHPQDVCNVDSNAHICTICLLEIEKGDLIADVKCGHFYHANCLSEWILKKVKKICQSAFF